MVLPNIFQLVNNKRWPPNLFYVKIDFTNAFFNIPLHAKSKHVTTFRYGGRFYKWEVLPFGISLAPYAMQKHLQALINEVKKFTPYVWGHIDDVIIAMESRADLHRLSLHIQQICEKIGWRINLKKSVLTPAESVKFLGSTWGATHVTRSVEASRTVALVLRGTQTRKLTGRTLQRVRGYLNYYLSFAGNFHALVNRILKRADKTPFTNLLLNIAKTDSIAFRPPDPTKYELIYTDASTYGIAACTPSESSVIARTSFAPILENELKAAILGVQLFLRTKQPSTNSLVLKIDNKAVIAFVNHGRCKWSTDIFRLANYLSFFAKIKRKIKVTASYVRSESNTADYHSRYF